MVKFRFQIQNCIDVEIEAENKTDARSKVIDRLNDGMYDDELKDAYVSDGEQI